MRTVHLLLACAAVWCLGAGSALALAVARLDGGWSAQAETAATIAADWARALPAASPVEFPHCWAADARARDACAVWYARGVVFPPAVDGRGAWLHVDDVAGALEVYLDGVRVVALDGFGLPQRIRLPGLPGPHHLALRLAQPEGNGDAGLGTVALQPIAPATLDVLLPEGDADAGRVSVRYRLLAEAPVHAVLHLELYAPERKRPIAKQAIPASLAEGAIAGTAEWRDLPPLLAWQAGLPRTYRVRAVLVAGGVEADRRDVPFGLMRYAWADGGLRLNGKPLVLKGLRVPGGACPDLAGDGARALEPVRQAGFTALMADELAFSRVVLDAAGRQGLSVVGYIPPRADAAAVVTALGAYPAVVGWALGSGHGPETVQVVRQWDPARPIFVCGGAQGTLHLPGDEPRTMALAMDGAWRDAEGTPVFAPGLAPAAPTACPLVPAICGDGRLVYTGEDRELVALRMLVEQVRRAGAPLGYFLRPFPDEPGLGLLTATGAPTKFHTAALAMNAPLLLTLRTDGDTYVGQPPAIEATIINDTGRADEVTLYRVVTTPEPDSQTLIARREAFVLTGAHVQPIPRTTFPFQSAERPGLYRVQYVLAERGRVISTAHVVVTVREAPP